MPLAYWSAKGATHLQLSHLIGQYGEPSRVHTLARLSVRRLPRRPRRSFTYELYGCTVPHYLNRQCVIIHVCHHTYHNGTITCFNAFLPSLPPIAIPDTRSGDNGLLSTAAKTITTAHINMPRSHLFQYVKHHSFDRHKNLLHLITSLPNVGKRQRKQPQTQVIHANTTRPQTQSPLMWVSIWVHE